jgi:hypothetical protein
MLTIPEYDKIQAYENSYHIAVDFDGVICESTKGFHDGTAYGEPIKDTIDSIKELYNKGFTLVVFTGKVKKDRPNIGGKTGLEIVEEWLVKYDLLKYFKEITSDKPRALIYIDDNGYRFDNWKNTLKFIDNISNTEKNN